MSFNHETPLNIGDSGEKLLTLGLCWKRQIFQRWISESQQTLSCFVLAMKATMRAPSGFLSPGRTSLEPSAEACVWMRGPSAVSIPTGESPSFPLTARTRRGTRPFSSRRPVDMRIWFGSCSERGLQWTAEITTAGRHSCKPRGVVPLSLRGHWFNVYRCWMGGSKTQSEFFCLFTFTDRRNACNSKKWKLKGLF